MAAAEVMSKHQDVNPCCATLKEKYSKLEASRNALRQGVKIQNELIDKLQNENLNLKKAYEEERVRSDSAIKEKANESAVRVSLENEISALKSEVLVLQQRGGSQTKDADGEITLLRMSISKLETEISQLKELVDTERMKADSERRKAKTEKKEANEVKKLLKEEKGRADEGRRLTEAERTKVREYQIQLEKLQNKADEAEALKSEVANKKLDAERQKVIREKKRADLAMAKTEEQRKLAEINQKKAMDEKCRADYMSKQLEEQKQRTEKLQKHADSEMKKAEEQKKVAEANKKKAMEEKHHTDQLAKQLEDNARRIEELQKQILELGSSRTLIEAPVLQPDKNKKSKTAEIKLLRKQLKFEKKQVKHSKEVAKLEISRNNILHHELCCLRESFGQFLHRMDILDNCFSRCGEGGDDREKGIFNTPSLNLKRELFSKYPHEVHLHCNNELLKTSCTAMNASDCIKQTIECTAPLLPISGGNYTQCISGKRFYFCHRIC